MESLTVIKNNGEQVVVANSRTVANNFGKRHGDVIAKIEKLSNSVSSEMANQMFIETTYVDAKGETRKEYLFTKNGLTAYLDSCRRNSKNLESVYNKYADFLNRDLKVVHTRKEIEFGKMLKAMFPNEDIIAQLPVLNYRTDFYLPFARIVVEYDENYHKYQAEKDEVRMCKILKELDKKVVMGEAIYEEVCTEPNPHLADKNIHMYIRVKEGKEIEGLRNIMLAIEEQTWNSPVDYMR